MFCLPTPTGTGLFCLLWLQQPFLWAAEIPSALPAALGCTAQLTWTGIYRRFVQLPLTAELVLSCFPITEGSQGSPRHIPHCFLGGVGQVSAALAVLGLLISSLLMEKVLFYIPDIWVLGHRSNCQIWAKWLRVHPPGAWAAPISCCFRAPSSPCWAPSKLWGHRNTFSTNVETGLEQLCKILILFITGVITWGSPIYHVPVF